MAVFTRSGAAPDASTPVSDEQLVEQVLAGQDEAFAVLMRRHNQRLYRLIRAITKDAVAAEDVLQQAYVSAYRHLAQFQGRAQFGTWLTKIAVNEALRVRRSNARVVDLQKHISRSSVVDRPRSPEDRASAKEWGRLLERAIDALPEDYRLVLVLRLVERVDTDVAANMLGITPQNVRVRLHRARLLVKDQLAEQVGEAIDEVYQFGGERCDRTVRIVMRRLFL